MCLVSDPNNSPHPHRNQPEIMELLLRKGASINVVNKARCSALHVAVNKQHAACVKVLVKYNCDVNVQVRVGMME